MTHDKVICKRCLLDSTIPDIFFDNEGICNYCHLHDVMEQLNPIGEKGEEILQKTVAIIKEKGKGKKYDCVVGVSGGADSTYTLYLVKQLGLRPLAVHLDNGWNGEIAVTNIKNATERLNVDLQTAVLDWEEFKDLQVAFLKSSTPDIEIPTDLAITATLWRTAASENIQYIINGHSFRTEGKIPNIWSYGDWTYIKSVYQKFGKYGKLKSYPKLSLFDYAYFAFLKRLKEFRILYFIDYRKDKIRSILTRELGWQEYGTKHHESTYTRFAHAYWLPQKFNMDKRLIHYSAQIRSGHLSREDALALLKQPPIASHEAKELVEYVRTKLDIKLDEYKRIFSSPNKTFHDYPNELKLTDTLGVPIRFIWKFISPSTPQSFLMNKAFFKEKQG